MISVVMEDYCLLCSNTELMKLLPPNYANLPEKCKAELPCKYIISDECLWPLLSRSAFIYRSLNIVFEKSMNIDLSCVSECLFSISCLF